MASTTITRRVGVREPQAPDVSLRHANPREVSERHESVERSQPGFRLYERRMRDAPFFLVERRKGKSWMYGSIALAAALWVYVIVQNRV